MLITNGIVKRNISAERFPEYKSKGYTEVKPLEEKTAPKKGNKTAKA
jgi:hypothetical protein